MEMINQDRKNWNYFFISAVITEIAAFENIELIAVKTLSWPTRILIMVKKKIQIQKL